MLLSGLDFLARLHLFGQQFKEQKLLLVVLEKLRGCGVTLSLLDIFNLFCS